MLKRHDTGPHVATFQKKLLRLGMSLTRWGADGDLGGETLEAVAALFRKHGREDKEYEVVSDEELAFVDKLIALLDDTTLRVSPPAKLIDRRLFAGMAGRDKDEGPRPITAVKGPCLHQTACYLSSSKDISRCDRVGAHFVVYPDGTVFWLHDVTRKISHGNEWNSQTYGIEIDGLFAGVEGVAATVWDDPKTPYKEKAGSITEAQIISTRQLIRWQHFEIARAGGHETVIVAHRQSSGSRRNDPGSKPWQEIALPMLKELGLGDGGPGFALVGKNGGYPIPEEWDPAKKGYKY